MKSRRCFPSFLLLVGGGLVAVVVATVAVHNQQQQQQQQRSRHTGEAGGDVHVDQLGVQRDLGGEDKDLKTMNQLWHHAGGHICLRGKSMRSTIIDGDTIFVQEGIGDKMYSYQMVHSDVVIAEINAYKNQRDKGETEGPSILDTEEMTDMSWVRKLRGVKYGCEVSELDDPLDTKNVVLQEEHEDGTSTWIVDNKWSVDVSSELIPWQLAAIDGGGAIEIHGVDTCPGMQIKGCNPETEGGAPAYTGPDERRLTEMVNTAISELSEDNDYDAQKGSIRKLDALSDFQHFGSQTNWCGTGSVAGNAACPGTGSVVTSPLYNYQADRACRRHDHGAYVEVFGGVIPRLECNVDRDLVGSCGGHPVVHAVFGDWGASQFWGCAEGYYVNSFNFWTFRWTSEFRKTFHYGPWRYNGRRWHWRYMRKDKYCYGDLW